MKLMICLQCSEILQLDEEVEKACSCGKSKGLYIDNLNAKLTGPALAICLSNPKLVNAIFDELDQMEVGFERFYGFRFDSWIGPLGSDSIEYDVEAILTWKKENEKKSAERKHRIDPEI